MRKAPLKLVSVPRWGHSGWLCHRAVAPTVPAGARARAVLEIDDMAIIS